jgi:hypothetical protein
VGERRDAYRVLMGKSERNRPLEDPGLDRWVILRRNNRKWDWRQGEARNGLMWLKIRTGCGLL